MALTDESTDTRATAATTRRAPHKPSPYRLAEVEKTLVPQDTSGQTWFRYVLDNGRAQITGARCGSLKSVTDYAIQYAEQLNARSLAGHSAWSPRVKKQA